MKPYHMNLKINKKISNAIKVHKCVLFTIFEYGEHIAEPHYIIRARPHSSVNDTISY
jgi:hypothetical protein